MASKGKISERTLYFEVTSNGRSADQLTHDLEKSGKRVSKHSQQILRSNNYSTTNGKTYKLGIIAGEEFSETQQIIPDVFQEARDRGWCKPTLEHALLLRERLSDEEIGNLSAFSEPVIKCGSCRVQLRAEKVQSRHLCPFETIGFETLYVMHEPFITPETDKAPRQVHVLGLYRGLGGNWLYACVLVPAQKISALSGFVFHMP